MFSTSSILAAAFPLATATQVGFLLMLGVYAVFTAVLYYHWSTYADNRIVTHLTFLIYFLMSLPCVGVMGIMAFTV